MDKSFWAMVIIVTLSVESIPVTALVSTQLTTENITITSEVTKVESLENYMIVHFKNGETYNIDYPRGIGNTITDFDDSKNVIVQLQKSNLYWFVNSNDCWYITRIIKY